MCFLTLSYYKFIFDICRKFYLSALNKYHVEIHVTDRARSIDFVLAPSLDMFPGQFCRTNHIKQANISRVENFVNSGNIY